MMVMFLLGTLAVVALISAIKDTKRLRHDIITPGSRSYIAEAITAFVVVAHISALHQAVKEISIVNILATLGLFTIWIATRSGTENQI